VDILEGGISFKHSIELFHSRFVFPLFFFLLGYLLSKYPVDLQMNVADFASNQDFCLIPRFLLPLQMCQNLHEDRISQTSEAVHVNTVVVDLKLDSLIKPEMICPPGVAFLQVCINLFGPAKIILKHVETTVHSGFNAKAIQLLASSFMQHKVS
jgi:hypothetical protein